MVEQPPASHLIKMLTQFRSTLQDLTREWGFVVVVTAYAADNGEPQWAAALEKLRVYTTPGRRRR